MPVLATRPSPITTWSRPPLDGSLDVANLIDYHVKHNAKHEAFATPSRAYTWAEVGAAIYRLVPLFKDSKIVAIAASGDNLTYFVTMLAIVRAGAVAFAISTNNSADGFVSLLTAKNADTVIVTRAGFAPEFEKTVNAALEEVPGLKQIEWPEADFSLDDVPQVPPSETLPLDTITMIFHSSGSTNHPKPIVYRHKQIIGAAGFYQAASDDYLRGDDPLCFDPNVRHYYGTLPAFHAFAMCCGFFQLLGTACTICMSDPVLPVLPVTPERALVEAKAVNAVDLAAVPMFLEAWARDDAAVKYLSSLAMVGYGGAHLDLEVGDSLVARGVRLMNLYASTESNLFISWRRADPALKQSWNYALPSKHAKVAFRPTGVEGQYEVLVGSSALIQPHLFNTEYEGEQYWAMGDGVELHPANPRLFRITGRLDTQIMLSTGEKVNPTALAPIIERSPLVVGALYFGRGKPFCGVLIEAASEVDVSDKAAVEAFRDEIWPYVEMANRHAPSHSHVFREMLVITPKPMARTAKRSIRIGIVLAENAELIEQAYNAFGRGSTVTAPTEWNEESTLAFITAVVGEALNRTEVHATDDIFQRLGGDSLRASKITNAINVALTRPHQVGSSFVYQRPTAAQLASGLLALVRGEAVQDEDRTEPLRNMIELYTKNWPEHKPTREAAEGDVVLLTGTTGGVGSHALEQAILDPRIVKVYSLSRSGKGSLLDRHVTAFTDRGIDVSLLSNPKVHLLEGDLERNEDLGVGPAKYNELRNSVTHIIHIAWRLDFNLSLASFEGSVAGTRNLVDLALRSHLPTPPPIIFTSSVGTLASWTSPSAVPEEPLSDLSIAIGNGYGESKAVAERILLAARNETPLKTCSVRVGQLCGSSEKGTWAKTEWLPLLVHSGSHPSVACLPSIPGCATWLPSDTCAKVLYDYARSSSLRAQHNLVSPAPISFDSAVKPIADALGVPVVDFSEWLSKLRAAGDALEQLPVLKLLPFFTSVQQRAKAVYASLQPGQLEPEAGVIARLATDEAVKVSQTLANIKPLTADDSLRWLNYWRDVGLL